MIPHHRTSLESNCHIERSRDVFVDLSTALKVAKSAFQTSYYSYCNNYRYTNKF